MVKEAYSAESIADDSKSQVVKLAEQPRTIAITSTFTAEPVAESLGFWLQELNIPANIEFAPYNQVFQQLLDPASLLGANLHGFNVVLVRLEDWLRHSNSRGTAGIEASDYTKIEQTVQDLVQALKVVAAQTATPYFVCLCPISPTASADQQTQTFFNQTEALIVSELRMISGLDLISSEELVSTYSVTSYYDPQSDELGHIPYTPLFFTALGTVLARKIHAIVSPPHKVIALDCDQTLWQGVCGEDGAMGIKLDPPRKALQDFMVAQYEAGMLICLCSKNNEPDVVEVFERRLDMPLKRDHIVSWRLNWNSKSENLKSLALELNLGLDSFIFVDDNPVECTEVQANCPEVLTLLLPQTLEEIPRFLQHVWAFDQRKITAEAQQRTTLYRQNLQRDLLQKQALSMEDFLVGLGLEIKISQLTTQHVARVAQLTQRTNQFNMTTIRRSEQEIQQMCQSGKLECLVVEVGDRFGDYGLVGVIVFIPKAEALCVDTFLLSCRVLGRGVEHRMLAQLGEIAQLRGKNRVDVPYVPTQKNQPALNFLNQIGIEFKQAVDEGYSFQFPVEYVRAVVYRPQAASSAPSVLPSQVAPGQVKTQVALEEKTIHLGQIAAELYSAQQVCNWLESQKHQRPGLLRPFIPASTETEQKLAQIWTQLLRIEQVGIQDNFFELGGTSVLAVRLFTQIENISGKKLPLATLLQAPTVEQLSRILCQEECSAPSPSLLAIQPTGSKPPLFCIAGAGGDTFYFRDLSSHLGLEQPVYGLQAQGLDGTQLPHTRIEDMAVYYIKEMRTLQPEGPYFLGGHSAGGLVALEMAQQLQIQGQKVALLALFDVITPEAMNHIPLFWDKAASVLINFIKFAPKQKIAYVLRILEYHPKNISKKIASLVGIHSPRPLPQDLSGPESLPQHIRQIFKLHEQAARDYVPQTYQGQVTLFKATDQPILTATSLATRRRYPLLGWERLAAGGVKLYEVPGCHSFEGSLLSEPYVRVLAEKLKTCLDDRPEQVLAQPKFKT